MLAFAISPLREAHIQNIACSIRGPVMAVNEPSEETLCATRCSLVARWKTCDSATLSAITGSSFLTAKRGRGGARKTKRESEREQERENEGGARMEDSKEGERVTNKGGNDNSKVRKTLLGTTAMQWKSGAHLQPFLLRLPL